MRFEIISGDSGKLWHETDDMEEATAALSWIIASKLSERGIVITVSTKQRNGGEAE